MISIKGFRGLEKYGIDYLTGESCAYGYRGLCDLTERGLKLVAECLGMDAERLRDGLAANWNSRSSAGEHVRSIMLAPQMAVPLAVFACIQSGCSKMYIMYDDTVVGIEASDKPEDVERWLSFNQGKYCEACNRYGAGGGVALQYSNPGFSRHQHQMSGRTT